MGIRRYLQVCVMACILMFSSCKNETSVQQISEYKALKVSKSNASIKSLYSASVKIGRAHV